MKKSKFVIFSCLSMLFAACSAVATQPVVKHLNEIAPFPDPSLDNIRSVIFLPEVKNEQDLKVELVIGKEMEVDCNQHRLSGLIKLEDLKGWGYPYYVVEQINNGFSTMMACAPDYKNEVKFITLNSDLGLIDYNSRLPIVIYTPKDMQVKYRIWYANDLIQSAIIE